MDESLALFVAEATARLDTLESELLALEQAPRAAVPLAGALRALHTIKGNAVVTGQGEIEWFSHVAESVLVRLRDGALRLDSELVSVLLACCDHLRFLVGMASLGDVEVPAFADEDRARLIGLLVPYVEGESIEASGQSSAPHVADPDGCWRIEVRFAAESLRRGLDPLGFLMQLRTLGEVQTLHTHLDALPALEHFNPEACYLHFSLSLETTAERQGIEDVFALAREGLQLRLVPPVRVVQECMGRIQAMPEDDLQTGEVLVRVGALTPSELARALQAQRAATPPRPIGAILAEQAAVPTELISAVLAHQDQVRQSQRQAARYLRVEAARVEALSARLDQALDLVRQLPAGHVLLAPLQQELRALGDELEELCRMPFGEFQRSLQRLVRDTSRALGKRAELRLSGAGVMLTRGAASVLGELLLHLVRNAVDHGIESPAQRLRAGKAAQGLLHVSALVEPAALVISVADDGAGIDWARVRASADARGILTANERADPGVLEAALFAPGLSTRPGDGRFSGRGVGLDVVQSVVQSLGGTVRVASQPGRGARFEVRLPGGLLAGVAQMARDAVAA